MSELYDCSFENRKRERENLDVTGCEIRLHNRRIRIRKRGGVYIIDVKALYGKMLDVQTIALKAESYEALFALMMQSHARFS